jgi:hypothetical protein
LLTDAKGHSRQVAFVQYTNRQDAEKAIMNLSGVIPPGGSLALIVKYATHPRQTQQHGYNANYKNKLPADLEYNFYELDMMNLQYPPNTPSPPPTVPSQHHYQSHSNASTGYTPPLSISGKVDQFLQTKPRSSDWIDSYAQPHSPPTLISTPPLPPPLTTSSTYPTFVTMSGVPPSLDIMDFHFLSKYGKVIDGKMMTRDIQVILPDGNPMNYQTSSGIMEFFVNVNSFQNFNHLLSLNDSMVVVEGHSIMVSLQCLLLSDSSPGSCLQSSLANTLTFVTIQGPAPFTSYSSLSLMCKQSQCALFFSSLLSLHKNWRGIGPCTLIPFPLVPLSLFISFLIFYRSLI